MIDDVENYEGFNENFRTLNNAHAPMKQSLNQQFHKKVDLYEMILAELNPKNK